ncbi:MAG: hypothetical protein JST83_07405 [Bacteroidetes bacterium]|nr:hypothetical protein [Bacteroidota bacterium]
MKRLLKILGYIFLVLVVLALGFFIYVKWGIAPDVPQIADKHALDLQRQKLGDNFYKIGHNWLRKSDSGLWEEYVEGAPFDRGVIAGKLTKELSYEQEAAFVEQIHKLVPNNKYLHLLGYLTRIFNRNLVHNLPDEYRDEIYGESLTASHDFDFVSPPYERLLNYHAAHDIGHAMQSLALVGCTSFGAWDEYTEDSTLLIGRNFDFYAGDKFAENKIVFFCKPTDGHKFAMITWAGMMGCVSGMNDQGLTVTINAAKSDMPTASATPISILAREILQHAGNIDEAYAIAKKRKTFVSESLLIGSAADHATALIEKSTRKTALLRADHHEQLCTNHYQSDSFKTDKNNVDNIRTSASEYRYERLQELLKENPKLDYKAAAKILRDQRGKGGKDIGLANEKAVNQLLSHHSVIFEPEKGLMWVSTQPFQLGAYECYDLNKVFSEAPTYSSNKEIREESLTIPADSFLLTDGWQRFVAFKKAKEDIKEILKDQKKDDGTVAPAMLRSNPNSWEAYYWVGELKRHEGQRSESNIFYEQALAREINDSSEVYKIRKLIKENEQQK